MAAKRNLADFLWPIGGTVFGLIVVPVAFAQYPQFFNENEWLLPASVAVVAFCWCFPLFLHSRARAIYSSISARGALAKVISAALSLAAIVALYFGAVWLLAMHRNHLHTLNAPKPKEIASENRTAAGGTKTRVTTVVRVPEVKLIFKASPLFTVERQKRITREVDAFRSYLVGIGFDPPKEFPPLGVLPGKRGLGMERQWPGDIYNETLGIGELNMDNPEHIRRLYAGYMFNKMFVTELSGDIDKRRNFQESAADIYQQYYVSSFTDKPPFANSGKWEKALWDIRQKHGKDF